MGLVANTPQVISERFENEVIVIHLEKGNYFSLRETAADAWVRLEAGQALTELEDSFTTRFGPEAAGDLQKFIADLQHHELVREGDTSPSAFTPVSVSAYTAPRLEIYTDMQELLLLDPVHDVDETGWPAERKA